MGGNGVVINEGFNLLFASLSKSVHFYRVLATVWYKIFSYRAMEYCLGVSIRNDRPHIFVRKLAGQVSNALFGSKS